MATGNLWQVYCNRLTSFVKLMPSNNPNISNPYDIVNTFEENVTSQGQNLKAYFQRTVSSLTIASYLILTLLPSYSWAVIEEEFKGDCDYYSLTVKKGSTPKDFHITYQHGYEVENWNFQEGAIQVLGSSRKFTSQQKNNASNKFKTTLKNMGDLYVYPDGRLKLIGYLSSNDSSELRIDTPFSVVLSNIQASKMNLAPGNITLKNIIKAKEFFLKPYPIRLQRLNRAFFQINENSVFEVDHINLSGYGASDNRTDKYNRFNNKGTINSFFKLNFTLNGGAYFENEGIVKSFNNTTISGEGKFINKNILEALNITLNVSKLSNQGNVIASKVTGKLKRISNSGGEINANEHIILESSRFHNNKGKVHAAQQVIINAFNFNNDAGSIKGMEDTKVTISEKFQNYYLFSKRQTRETRVYTPDMRRPKFNNIDGKIISQGVTTLNFMNHNSVEYLGHISGDKVYITSDQNSLNAGKHNKETCSIKNGIIKAKSALFLRKYLQGSRQSTDDSINLIRPAA